MPDPIPLDWDHLHRFDGNPRALRQHLWAAKVPGHGHNVPSSVVSPVGSSVTGQVREEADLRAYHVGLHYIAELDRRERLAQGDSTAGYGPAL